VIHVFYNKLLMFQIHSLLLLKKIVAACNYINDRHEECINSPVHGFVCVFYS
jgi:hypothetical protein